MSLSLGNTQLIQLLVHMKYLKFSNFKYFFSDWDPVWCAYSITCFVQKLMHGPLVLYQYFSVSSVFHWEIWFDNLSVVFTKAVITITVAHTGFEQTCNTKN